MYREKRENERGSRYGGGRPQRPQPRKHNPLPEGFSLFYMAILCPGEIEEKLKGFKEFMEKQYGCRAAKKSPAHLTIVPPFRAENEMEKLLLDFVQTFNMGMVPVDISLNGFGSFGERVLFVDVAPNPSLHSLEQEAMQEFGNQFPGIIFGLKPEFNPHVTIATRDIPEGRLPQALEYFKANHEANDTFGAKELTLLKLVNGWWQVCS